MASVAQVQANRFNAQKSTGPRTPEGKAKVAQNAVTHGLLARAAVLQGEDWEEYTCYHEKMLRGIGSGRPAGNGGGGADRQSLLAAAPGGPVPERGL